ncbi:MAG: threonylcarbamoyl-AMP synthase [Clostridia bacterium]|nr:threonylcarbamoyl-AMP synthase [Clostridia bacterium]
MKTEIIKIDPRDPDPVKLQYCGAVIRYGGIVAFPTETVYGLGANAFMASAATKVFEAKGRPADNPLIVHVCDYDMAETAACFASPEQERLFYALGSEFWPGPFTMIVKKRDTVPDNITCGLGTAGIRMPSNAIAARLIRAAGVPVAAPSANSSGRPSPTRFAHVLEDMRGKADVIIDGGDSNVGVESTVVDLSGPVPMILRPGAVTRDDIARIAGDCLEYDWLREKVRVDKPLSPGMKYRHYAPRAKMTVYAGEREAVRDRIISMIRAEKKAGKRAGVLATEEQICYYKEADAMLSLGPENEPEEHARRLFGALRKFDEENVDVIYAQALGLGGVDDAVMNRMFRAAGGTIEQIDS